MASAFVWLPLFVLVSFSRANQSEGPFCEDALGLRTAYPIGSNSSDAERQSVCTQLSDIGQQTAGSHAAYFALLDWADRQSAAVQEDVRALILNTERTLAEEKLELLKRLRAIPEISRDQEHRLEPLVKSIVDIAFSFIYTGRDLSKELIVVPPGLHNGEFVASEIANAVDQWTEAMIRRNANPDMAEDVVSQLKGRINLAAATNSNNDGN